MPSEREKAQAANKALLEELGRMGVNPAPMLAPAPQLYVEALAEAIFGGRETDGYQAFVLLWERRLHDFLEGVRASVTRSQLLADVHALPPQRPRNN